MGESEHRRTLVDFLKDRKHETIAEIGVWKGVMAKHLLENLPGIRQYYCVDCWELYPDFKAILREKSQYSQLNYNDVYEMYLEAVSAYSDKITTLRMYSEEAVKHVPDRSLDFAFIDANHAYKYVKQDIILWLPKVKHGGILSGHDYKIKRFGVKRAVDEFFQAVSLLPNFVWWVDV